MSGSVKYNSLTGATATGAGASNEQHSGRYIWTMQVTLTGSPTGCKVTMEGSNDGGTTWGVIAVWDLAAGQVSGDFVTSGSMSISQVRANLKTLSGGASPAVTAIITGEPN